jgi:quinolinate synthase
MRYLADKENPTNGTRILSASGIDYAEKSPGSEFIVATDVGILHQLREHSPQKSFMPANPEAVCRYMKRITLEKVLRALQELVYEVNMPESVASRARTAIDEDD